MATDGFEIRRGIFGEEQVESLRREADLIAEEAGSACVRHLRSRSGLMEAVSLSSALLTLLPAGMIPVRSILFDKTAAENWPVPWHQDLTIAVAEERPVEGYGPWSSKDGAPHVQAPESLLGRMVTIRLHLDDTPASNGALRVRPGSHLQGRIPSNLLASDDFGHFVTCECAAGDALLMSPLILHSSSRSERPARRRVLHFEYARPRDLDPRLDWFELSASRDGHGLARGLGRG